MHLPHQNKAPSQTEEVMVVMVVVGVRPASENTLQPSSHAARWACLPTTQIMSPSDNRLREREARDWRVCDELKAQSVHCERPSLMCILTRQPRRGYAENATKRKMDGWWWWRGTVINNAGTLGDCRRCFLSGCGRAAGCVLQKAERCRLLTLLLPPTTGAQPAGSQPHRSARTVMSTGLLKRGSSGGWLLTIKNSKILA